MKFVDDRVYSLCGKPAFNASAPLPAEAHLCGALMQQRAKTQRDRTRNHSAA